MRYQLIESMTKVNRFDIYSRVQVNVTLYKGDLSRDSAIDNIASLIVAGHTVDVTLVHMSSHQNPIHRSSTKFQLPYGPDDIVLDNGTDKLFVTCKNRRFVRFLDEVESRVDLCQSRLGGAK